MRDKKQSCLYYYRVGAADLDPLAMICVDKDIKGFDADRFYKGEWISDWPEGITFYVKGGYSDDYLIGGLHWKIISEKVRQTFERCKVEGGQFLPVQVVHEETKHEIGPYWVLNIVRLVEALDWEQSQWLYPEEKTDTEYPILNILKEVLCRKSLIGIDIFRLKVKKDTGQVYISPRLRSCLEEEGAIKGFGFLAVPAR